MWSPGIFPDDADKFALCEILTVNLLTTSKELQQHMLNVVRILNEA